jgi:hypothetical protein
MHNYADGTAHLSPGIRKHAKPGLRNVAGDHVHVRMGEFRLAAPTSAKTGRCGQAPARRRNNSPPTRPVAPVRKMALRPSACRVPPTLTAVRLRNSNPRPLCIRNSANP